MIDVERMRAALLDEIEESCNDINSLARNNPDWCNDTWSNWTALSEVLMSRLRALWLFNSAIMTAESACKRAGETP